MTNDQDLGSIARHNPASKTPWIILGVIVILLIAAAIIFRKQAFRVKVPVIPVTPISMVYLTNGQILFAEVTNQDSNYVTLTNPYIPQQVGTSTQQSLVRFGEQPYLLKPTMSVNRASVLMISELQASSSVVSAIKGVK